MSRGEFAVRLAMCALAVACALILYYLVGVLLILFAALLVALAIHALADPFVNRFDIRRGRALVASGMAIVLVPLAIVAAFGSELSAQMTLAVQNFPTTSAEIADLLAMSGIPPEMLARLGQLDIAEPLARFAAETVANAVELMAAGILAIATGCYLAAQPRTYLDGLLAFVSLQRRMAIEAFCIDLSTELKHWLVAQIVLMVMVGTLTGLGAWILGVPAPLALGITAGLLEVVPYLGPVLATVPAFALGMSISIEVAALMMVWIFAVQQLEGLVLTPLVLKRAVRLPPAVSLLALVAAGILLGPVGVLLAAPAAVVGYVVYRRYTANHNSSNHLPSV
ncbi:AI-2E family transporter [Qipengyuania zhejiangensis]|uniref:AI-2E family transporter n=1 Tax=Qipengyuania zhejiangensis TaxID=3077782 RepID=UPI002D7696B5|nr:AI-2E family transporter [Qipengyuania sp. Z2]